MIRKQIKHMSIANLNAKMFDLEAFIACQAKTPNRSLLRKEG